MPRYVLALDQGTTSSRAILFDEQGSPCFKAQREIRQSYPEPGWAEHDPVELFQSILEVGRSVMNQAGIGSEEITAIGLTNQRETTVLWDRATSLPTYPALVWQDRRTAARCQQLRAAGLESKISRITGLEIDPYFSATKLEWLLQSYSGPNLAFGTVDSWLLWNLTGGAVHATDATNASRTMLFDLESRQWSSELMELFGISPLLLPEVFDSSYPFGMTSAFGGSIPITGIAGDQQAALFGQACHREGMSKCTYGTGAFLLTVAGTSRKNSQSGLLTTLGATPTAPWVLEGSVFAAGSALNWLTSGLKMFGSVQELEALACTVLHSGGVQAVPAFAGLGAPHWTPSARAALLGLTLATGRAEIARAMLESVALQCTDVLGATESDLAHSLREVRVDGGLAQSNLLLQTQADLLGVPVLRATVGETTALGAAMLAGLQAGFWSSLDEVESLWKCQGQFEPQISETERLERLSLWRRAVASVQALK
jgi:glycerol kinase